MRAMVTFWSLHSRTVQQCGTAPLFCSGPQSATGETAQRHCRAAEWLLEWEFRSPVYQPNLSPNLQHR